MGSDVPATAVRHRRLSLYSQKRLKPLDVLRGLHTYVLVFA